MVTNPPGGMEGYVEHRVAGNENTSGREGNAIEATTSTSSTGKVTRKGRGVFMVNNGRVFMDEYLDLKDFDSWHHNVLWIRQGNWETGGVDPDVKRALEMMEL